MSDKMSMMQRAIDVQARHTEVLMELPNVVGVAVGKRERDGETTEETCLVVMVDRKFPLDELEPAAIIPTEIDGVPVDVREIGPFEAL